MPAGYHGYFLRKEIWGINVEVFLSKYENSIKHGKIHVNIYGKKLSLFIAYN